MRAEMAHYRAHTREAVDAAALAPLRLECAWVLADVLALGPGGPELLPALGDAISYRLYPDALYALDRLRDAGLRARQSSPTGTPSLHDALRSAPASPTASRPSSSRPRSAPRSPRRRPSRPSRRQLGSLPHRILHVGDDPERDVDGALAAGFHALLVQRDATPARRRPRVATLAELPALLDLDHGSPDG